MRAPSGENTALVTRPVWPRRTASGLPSRFHRRALLPSEAIRMRAPSGENTALVTGPVSPCTVASGLPLRSHSRTVPSVEVVRMRPPSGANTALRTKESWPRRMASGLPSRSQRHISTDHGPIKAPSPLRKKVRAGGGVLHVCGGAPADARWPASAGATLSRARRMTTPILDSGHELAYHSRDLSLFEVLLMRNRAHARRE
jgi:hypothetical protein